MPTYEYACRSCNIRLEVVQRFAEDPLFTCNACGGRLRRVFHPAGILFKGSGFYSTDVRSAKRDAAKQSAKAGSEAGKDAKAKGEPSSTATKALEKPSGAEKSA